MAIQPGQMLLHYRIVEKIGAGGMGEVWSAEDTKLRRKIAIKTLPPWTADDERLRARFEHEAQAVAALNHPNIVTAYSVEEADGQPFLTMELVDGRSLSRLLKKEALSRQRFFDLALPLTDAVAAAHDAGILHRDLKPDNVMITTTDKVKVLDFGLAKLRDVAAPVEPTEGPTGEEKTFGSAAYMSPEQAEGKAVGPPSDVFALGILLYRMASGKHPFSGGTSIAMISSILKDDPPSLTQLDPGLHGHVVRIIRRCLDKDPARRYATARELHLELQLLREEIIESGDTERTRPKRSPALALVAMVALALAVVAVAGWMRKPRGDAVAGGGVMQFSQQTFRGGVETNPTLSPDGQYLAYEALSADGDSDVFLQRVDGHNPINLTEDSDVFDGAPAFSPDGTHIAFRSNREVGGIYVMGATGENVRRIADFGFDPAWSPDGTQIAFATEPVGSPTLRYHGSTLWIADVESGETREIYTADAVQPAWSPKGKRIAFWTAHVGDPAAGERDVGTVRPDGSDPVILADTATLDWRPVWSPDGRELFFASDRGGSMNLWRVPINEDSGATRGAPRPLPTPALWSGPFTISSDGSHIAYVARDETARIYSVGFDPARAAPVGLPSPITGGSLLIFSWDPSPDGEWVAFTTGGRQEDVYLVRKDGSDLRKVTDDLDKDRGVTWVDDQRLIFYSNQGGGYEIWTIRRDGSERKQLTETAGDSLWMPEVSPDGRTLLLHNGEGTYLFDLDTPGLLHKEQARALVQEDSEEALFRGLHWSPDGKRILGTRYAALSATAAAVYDLDSDSLAVYHAPGDADSMAGGWLPDGKRFVATTGARAWVVDAGKDTWKEVPLQVGPNGGPAGTAKPTRDGRTLQFIRTTSESDIWLARTR